MNVNTLTESDRARHEAAAVAMATGFVKASLDLQRHVRALHAALDLADEWDEMSVHSFDPDDRITTRDIHIYNRAGRTLRLAIRNAMEGKE